MATEVAYDSELNTFHHDRSRGKWSKSSDFLFACIGHAFKIDAVLILPSLLLEGLGIYGIIPYFLLLAVCVVPVVFIQSFLGQFSSTGFISVFRISPLFKSIGYIGLAVNVVVLMYFGVYGSIPLFYLFNTLRPTIPWSCEGAKEWMNIDNGSITPCTENYTIEFQAHMAVPSLEFFKHHLNVTHMYMSYQSKKTFSVWLMLCTFVVWFIVGAVLVQPMEKIAKFLRYTCTNMLIIMGLIVVRFAFLPGAFPNAINRLLAKRRVAVSTCTLVTLIGFSALGPGWGNVITMASFNKFKKDTLKYSWFLCLAQFGVMLGMGLMALFVTGFLQNLNSGRIYTEFKYAQWMEFLITPSAMSFIEIPRFWTWIFFGMMLLGTLNLLTVQMLSVLTSLFDEFESLRDKKKKITLIGVGAMALCSIPFCSNVGFMFFEVTSLYLMAIQMLLNLLLLLVVLWIYGRERLQRDIAFMSDVVCATWKVHTVRIVTPFFLVVAMATAFIFATRVPMNTLVFFSITVSILALFWIAIPGCCCFTMKRVKHCKRATQPVGWYPADPADRQKYEETLDGTSSVLVAMADDGE